MATFFISYSWDSEDHKAWVLELSRRLRGDGIDVVLDETHLDLGERLPEFIERSVRESDNVLVICTEGYKRRFDQRRGGVGYEGHIISGEILAGVGNNKFIPVLRQGEWNAVLPKALDGVKGVDLREDSETEYRTLVTRLHGSRDIPPLGPRPQRLIGLIAEGHSPAIHSKSPKGSNDGSSSLWCPTHS